MALMLLIAGVCDGMSGTFTDGFRMVMGENADFRWLIFLSVNWTCCRLSVQSVRTKIQNGYVATNLN